MNKKTINIQEDDLHAYVDKQLSTEKIEAVEALMRKSPEVALKVQQWQQQNESIAILFNKNEFSEIPERLNIEQINLKQNNNSSKSHPWVYSMVASLLMLVSGSIGWFAHSISKPNYQNNSSFVSSAISAHQVFSVEKLHPVEVGAEKQDHLVAWLSTRIDHPLKVPQLQEYGYSFLGGRLLSMQKGSPAAQFMFENKKGQRITWLISKNPAYRDRELILKEEGDVNAYYWMDSKVAYSVTSEINHEELQRLSQAIYLQTNKQPKKVASI